MPSGATDTFSGTNGSALGSNWVTALAEGTGAATQQSGNARLRTGSTTGQRISVRLNISARSDAEVIFNWAVPSAGSTYGAAWFRANSAIDTATGYGLSLEANDMYLSRSPGGYANVNVAQHTHGFAAGTNVKSRIAVFGNRIRARTWRSSDPEPTNVWQIDYTDSSPLAAGSIGMTNASGVSGARDFNFDNYAAFDTITPSQATASGSGGVVPTGDLGKVVLKTFSGATTPAGATSVRRVVVRLFSGATTPTGVSRRALTRIFGGATTPSGTLRKTPLKRLLASTAPGGSLVRKPIKRLSGQTNTQGALATADVGRIFGRPGLVVIRVIQQGVVRVRHRKG